MELLLEAAEFYHSTHSRIIDKLLYLRMAYDNGVSSFAFKKTLHKQVVIFI